MVVVVTAAAALVLAGTEVVSAKLMMTETETDLATVANTRGTHPHHTIGIGMLRAKWGTEIPVTESPAGTRGMIAAAAAVAGPSGAVTAVQEQEQEQEQEGGWGQVAVASASA